MDGCTTFPFPTMKVKVFDRGGDFAAFANVNLRTGGEAGLGDSVEEAVNDLLLRFVAQAKERAARNTLNEADFEWSAPEDF